MNISISQLCEPSYRYPKLRGINHDAHPARFWLALVPCAVAGALAIGIAISALCANLAVSAAAADAQSSYQFANLSAKGDRLSLPATTWTRSLTKQSDPRLPDGCEALVSFLTTSDNAIVAGFCETIRRAECDVGAEGEASNSGQVVQKPLELSGASAA